MNLTKSSLAKEYPSAKSLSVHSLDSCYMCLPGVSNLNLCLAFKESISKASSTGLITVPRTWYYDLMLFFILVCFTRQVKNNQSPTWG